MSLDPGLLKQLCVLYSFNSGLPPDIALIHAQNSFPFITLQEIETLYELFRSGLKISLDGKSNQSVVTQPGEPIAKKYKICQESSSALNTEKEDKFSIEKIPFDILENILTNSSTGDQKALHNASLLLSGFISNNFKTYQKVEFYLTKAAVLMKIEKHNPRVMDNSKPGQKRKLCANETKESIESKISSETIIPKALEIFKEIIHSTNVKISQLHFHHEEDVVSDQRKKEFYSGIQEVFNKFKGEIHVEELSIFIKDVDSLMSVLCKLKPGVLVELDITNTIKSKTKISMDRIVESVHWKSLKTVSESWFTLDLKLDQIIHLRQFFGTIVDPTIEELVAHKDKLLQSSLDFCYQDIYMNNVDGIMEAFQPFAPHDDFTKKGGKFFCQNNKTLRFTLKSSCLEFVLQQTEKS